MPPEFGFFSPDAYARRVSLARPPLLHSSASPGLSIHHSDFDSARLIAPSGFRRPQHAFCSYSSVSAHVINIFRLLNAVSYLVPQFYMLLPLCRLTLLSVACTREQVYLG